MVEFNLDTFKAQLIGGGARANLFKVIVNYPAFAGGDSVQTTYMAHKAVFPASKTNVVEVPFKGRKLPISGDRTYEGITISFFNDINHPVRRSFLQWKDRIDNHSGSGGLSAPSEYTSEVIIQQLDKNNKVMVEHKLIGAWPSEISEINLDWNTTDEIEAFDVQFRYLYWEEDGVTR